MRGATPGQPVTVPTPTNRRRPRARAGTSSSHGQWQGPVISTRDQRNRAHAATGEPGAPDCVSAECVVARSCGRSAKRSLVGRGDLRYGRQPTSGPMSRLIDGPPGCAEDAARRKHLSHAVWGVRHGSGGRARPCPVRVRQFDRDRHAKRRCECDVHRTVARWHQRLRNVRRHPRLSRRHSSARRHRENHDHEVGTGCPASPLPEVARPPLPSVRRQALAARGGVSCSGPWLPMQEMTRVRGGEGHRSLAAPVRLHAAPHRTSACGA